MHPRNYRSAYLSHLVSPKFFCEHEDLQRSFPVLQGDSRDVIVTHGYRKSLYLA